MSKVDTRTLIEEGRYLTRADGLGNPSRTSVGVAGDVAVANRAGGVIKIYANSMACPDLNGNGVVDTSMGPDNILPWGTDEGVAWYHDMTFGSQRAVAWTYAKERSMDGDSEEIIERIWVTGVLNSAATEINVMLLDGESGVIIDQTVVPGFVTPFPYGSYGGAVDGNNDFFFSNLVAGHIARVSYDDLTVTKWAKPIANYGMTVDPVGRVWLCGTQTARFDPQTGVFETATFAADYAGMSGGCMVDGKHRLWMDIRGPTGSSASAIDTQTLEVVQRVDLPEHPHGISIDFDAKVWAVGMTTAAYKVDPDTGTFETVTGLVSPYTYSDMTGFALANVQDDPPER